MTTKLQFSGLLICALFMSAPLVPWAASAEFQFGLDGSPEQFLVDPGHTLKIPVVIKNLSGASPALAGVNWTISIVTTSSSTPSWLTSQLTTSGLPFTKSPELPGSFELIVPEGGASDSGSTIFLRGMLCNTATVSPASAETITLSPGEAILLGTYELEIPCSDEFASNNSIHVSFVLNGTGEGSEAQNLGVCDVDGKKIWNGGDIAINSAPIQISGTFPRTASFAGSAINGWKYTAGFPLSPPASVPVGDPAGVGLKITSVVQNSFGMWNYDRGPDTAPPIEMRRPPSCMVYSAKFKVGTDREGEWTSGEYTWSKVPVIRHLISTNENFFSTQNVIQQSPGFDPPITIPTPSQAKYYYVLMQTPSFADDTGPLNGVYALLDMLQLEGIGQPGASIWLESLSEHVTVPSDLTGSTVVYDETFDETDTGIGFVDHVYKLTNGWGFYDFDPEATGNDNVVTIPGANKPVTYHYADERGIGISSSGGIDIPYTSTSSFSLGLWETRDNITRIGGGDLLANSSKWYKVELTVKLLDPDIEDLPKPYEVYGPIVRVRMFVPTFDNFLVSSLSPFANKGDLTLPRPDADGETFTSWFRFTPESNGQPIRLGLDLVHHEEDYSIPPVLPHQPYAQSRYKTPTLFFSNVKITEFNAPEDQTYLP